MLPTRDLHNALLEQARQAVIKLEKTPHLAVILVGDNRASQLYVKRKQQAAETIGVSCTVHHLPTDTEQATLLHLINTLNMDEGVQAILLQLPVPDGLDKHTCLDAIDPTKDVDGLGKINTEKLYSPDDNGLVPATPLGVMRILAWAGVPIANKTAVVVGRSHLVGRPMAELLRQAGAQVTSVHKATDNIPAILQTADIIISAAGCPNLVTAGQIKPEAVVIDVGINTVTDYEGQRTVVGDVHPNVVGKAALLTPVPRGVGPMTVATLLTNMVEAAYQQAGLAAPAWIIPPRT